MKNRICPVCGEYNGAAGKYCQACYSYFKLHPEGVYELPRCGEVKYAINGDPICHICGMAYKKLGSHIHYKHNMTQKEYRDKFHLYRNTKLTNMKYRNKMIKYNEIYKEKVIAENLLEKGKNTRMSHDNKIIKERRKYGRPIKEVHIGA